MIYYNQCILHKYHSGDEFEGYRVEVQTSWIPEQYAYEGNFVTLKEKNGWSLGWQIVDVGTRLPEDQVLENSQDYKRTRKASDI